MFAQYHRCYYELSKELLDRSTPTQRRRLFWNHFFDWLFFLTTGGHLLFGAYLLATDFTLNYPYRHYDPAVYLMVLYGTKFSAFLPVAFVILGAFHIVCQVEVYRMDVRKPVWQFWRQLIVQSQDDYEECKLKDAEINSKISNQVEILLEHSQFKLIKSCIPRFILIPICKILSKCIIFYKLENINHQQWSRRKLALMPNMSPQLRRKIILMLLITDKVGFWVQVMIAPICLAFVFIHYTDYTRGFVWYAIVWVVYDGVAVGYSLLRLLRIALWFTNCCLFVVPAFAWHSNEICGQIEKCIARYRRKQNPISVQALWQFLQNHNAVCHLFVAGKREIFSTVQFAFLASNIPINIYIIQRVVFHKQNTLEMAAIWATLAIQSSAGYISLRPLAYVCKCLHRPLEMLPALQQCLGGRRRVLFYKLKLDDLVKRLGSGPKYAITIGPLMEVTDEKIMEVVGIYVAHLLMVFSAQIEARLGN